jgi:methylglutaconyl-CoA hydratase
VDDTATTMTITGGVARITLNRPDNRNALSRELVTSLWQHMDAALDDPAARVIVLTGSGNTFCAGADLKEQRAPAAGGEAPPPTPGLPALMTRVHESPKPVVGRINGHALAGGLGLAASCDLSIAAESATMGFTEVRIGVAPAIISVVCLPKMRIADAAELFLTGERIPAAKAAEVGLINRAVPDDQLDAAVDELVGKLLLGGPIALGKCKELLWRVPKMEREEAFDWAAEYSAALFRSPEGQEGLKAFAERRRPSWLES